MTRAGYLIAIRKLIAAYKRKYDAFGKKKNGSKKSRTQLFCACNYHCVVNNGFNYIYIRMIKGDSTDYNLLDNWVRTLKIKTDKVLTCEIGSAYRDWETDRKSTRLNSSH